MARPLVKSAPLSSAWSDIPSLLMLGTGTLLYLALISYVPERFARLGALQPSTPPPTLPPRISSAPSAR